MRRLWIAAIVITVVVIVISSLSPEPILPNGTLSDKAGHYLAYLALALLGSGIVAPDRLWRTMFRCFLLGAALEIAQGIFTAHRLAEWGDLLANVLGILTAWIITAQGRAGWGLRAFAWLARGRPS